MSAFGGKADITVPYTFTNRQKFREKLRWLGFSGAQACAGSGGGGAKIGGTFEAFALLALGELMQDREGEVLGFPSYRYLCKRGGI